MRRSLIFGALLLKISVLAQDPGFLRSIGFPACVIPCVRYADSTTKCNVNDASCICGSEYAASYKAFLKCNNESKPCTQKELDEYWTASKKYCGAVSNDIFEMLGKSTAKFETAPENKTAPEKEIAPENKPTITKLNPSSTATSTYMSSSSPIRAEKTQMAVDPSVKRQYLGIGVGISIGLVALAGLGMCYLMKRRRKRRLSSYNSHKSGAEIERNSDDTLSWSQHQQRHEELDGKELPPPTELENSSLSQELESHAGAHELDGHSAPQELKGETGDIQQRHK